MRKLNGSHIYSPSDLITFMESEYASWMDRFYLECPNGVQPDKDAVEDRILQAMGEQHERAFLRELVDDKHDVCDLKGERDPLATVEAMRAGRGVIYQGAFALGAFAGIADFLVHLQHLLAKRKYQMLFSTKRGRQPGPKGPSKELVDAVVKMKRKYTRPVRGFTRFGNAPVLMKRPIDSRHADISQVIR